MSKVTYVLCLLIIGFGTVLGMASQSNQDQFPVIGEPVPDFLLEDIMDYSYKRIGSSDLRGKCTILYFWSRYCSSAVRNIAKVDSLNKRYKGKLHIFLVGGEAEDAGVDKYTIPGMEAGMDNLKALYSQLKEKQGLHCPAVFDPKLFQRFVPESKVPYIVYIDQKGIVKAITNTIDGDKIDSFLAGKTFYFRDTSSKAKQKASLSRFDIPLPFMENQKNEQESPILYRSTLAKYARDGVKIPRISNSMEAVCRDNGYIEKGLLRGSATVEDLYRLAYFGYVSAKGQLQDHKHLLVRDYSQLMLNMKNDSIFTDFDYGTRANLFVYSLKVPKEKAEPTHLMETMQRDLKTYFGYQVKIENKLLPYWRITATDKAKRKLKTAGGDFKMKTDGFTNFSFQNISVDKYFDTIFYMVSATVDIPIINETGITESLDIPNTSALLSNFKQIRNVLKEQGFNMEKVKKEFRVIVISD